MASEGDDTQRTAADAELFERKWLFSCVEDAAGDGAVTVPAVREHSVRWGCLSPRVCCKHRWLPGCVF